MPNEQSNEAPKTSRDYETMVNNMKGDQATPQMEAPRAEVTNTTEPTYTDQVNALIKEVATDEDTGKLVYPDETPEHLKYAVAAEKKYRDTQVSFTKGQQNLKEVEGENQALREQLANSTSSTLELSKEETERLDDLMYSDPSAWRREMNDLESNHSQGVQKKLKESMGEVRSKAGAQFELDRRVEVLKQFNEGRVDPITVKILDNEIPPRISKKLADGHLTFEGYLAEVDEYLGKGKVVNNPDSGSGTKLNQSAGSAAAISGNAQNDGAVDYASVIF